jgi:hypothetical protein
MKMATAGDRLTDGAAEALKEVLGTISSITLRELKCAPMGPGRAAGILARVEVLGRTHTLVCEVKDQGNARQLRTALGNLHSGGTQHDGRSTFVIIAPYLSPEAQTLCKETNTSFIDFEGNARIAFGEIFISKRTMRPRIVDHVAIDPVMIEEAKSRPPAPMVYIASSVPGTPVRVREGAKPGTAVA